MQTKELFIVRHFGVLKVYEDVFFYHDQLRKTWRQNYFNTKVCFVLL